MKKRLVILYLFLHTVAVSWAQNDTIFTRTVYNSENDIYMIMDFQKKSLTLPGQDFMGEMAGYIGDYQDARKWLILDAEIIDEHNASLSIVNDECSEDLEAIITYNEDGTYTLKQGEGSTIKIVRNRKWKKLPKQIIFTKKRDIPVY